MLLLLRATRRSARQGVRVFGVNLGPARTERIVHLVQQRAMVVLGDAGRWEEMLRGLPMGRLMEPYEVASLLVFGSSDRANYLSGTAIDMDGGQRYAPMRR